MTNFITSKYTESWGKLADRLGLDVALCVYVGISDFWADPQPATRIKQGALSVLEEPTPLLASTQETSRFSSTSCRAIVTRRPNDCPDFVVPLDKSVFGSLNYAMEDVWRRNKENKKVAVDILSQLNVCWAERQSMNTLVRDFARMILRK